MMAEKIEILKKRNVSWIDHWLFKSKTLIKQPRRRAALAEIWSLNQRQCNTLWRWFATRAWSGMKTAEIRHVDGNNGHFPAAFCALQAIDWHSNWAVSRAHQLSSVHWPVGVIRRLYRLIGREICNKNTAVSQCTWTPSVDSARTSNKNWFVLFTRQLVSWSNCQRSSLAVDHNRKDIFIRNGPNKHQYCEI